MIGDVITATLPLMRSHAESLMTDACDVDRLTTVWNEESQKSVTTWATVYAAVPCHVEEPSVASRSLQTDEAVTLAAPLVKLPYTFDGVQPDDRVTVTGLDPVWVTHAAHDDSTHPVEMLLQCRRTR